MMEYDCPICRRHFVRAPKHLYKDGKNYFCSWTCYMHRNDEMKRRAVEQYTKYGTSVHVFKTIEDAADIIGGNVQEIDRACINCTFYKGYLWRYKDDVSKLH